MSSLPWVYLLLAGIFEVGFTTFLKMSNGFSKALPTAAFIACIGLSFYLLNKAIIQIPLGTAYAIFTGIGVLGTVLIQVYFFGGSISLAKIIFIALLLIAILGLKITT